MKSNLIILNALDTSVEKLYELINIIKRKFNLSTVELTESTVFSDIDNITSNLVKYLGNRSIVVADFSKLNISFETLDKLLVAKYQVKANDCQFGWFYQSHIGNAILINCGINNWLDSIDNKLINSIFNIQKPCAFLKLFGLTKSNLNQLYRQIPNNDSYDISVFSQDYVSEISIAPKQNFSYEKNDIFVRNLYLQFDDYWFSDNQDSLSKKLDEILTLRKIRICIADKLTGGYFETFLKTNLPHYNQHIVEFYNIYENIDLIEQVGISTDFINDIKKNSVDFVYEMSAVLLEKQIADLVVSLYKDGEKYFISIGDFHSIHVYKYTYNYDEEYIKRIISNQTIFKILKKFRGNPLSFFENDV